MQPLPKNSIFAHYEQLQNGSYAVVTANHKILAQSFYDLRNTHSFFMSINGAGAWVVLIPHPQPTQLSLFS